MRIKDKQGLKDVKVDADLYITLDREDQTRANTRNFPLSSSEKILLFHLLLLHIGFFAEVVLNCFRIIQLYR